MLIIPVYLIAKSLQVPILTLAIEDPDWVDCYPIFRIIKTKTAIIKYFFIK